ncbi:glycosyl hydrolase family 71-domain-containing protein [Mrakia frigida]|uniref:glycosyl hydrolase family 71-domain-containing protein n=1 Tax=Mrakia frigida TaxID=29902 RepID=UPI003FCC0303
MTIDKCTARCSSLGYTLAGLEYSTQCYCSSSLATASSAVAATECSSKCAGASSTSCGGAYRLNLYSFDPVTTAAVVATTQNWVDKGCYLDSSSPRTLPSNFFESSAMTSTLCKATCKSAGYTFAGTQYSTQCWCGNAIDPKGTVQLSSSCNSICSGSSSEYCGGTYRLSVYQLVTSVASSTSTTSLVPSTSSTSIRSSTSIASTTSSSSVRSSSSSSSSSRLSSSSLLPSTSSSRSSSTSSSSAITSSRSSSTSSSTSTTSSAATLAAGSWAYSGCYLDANIRTLPSYSFTSTSMTIDTCQVGCLARGYVFAGLEAGWECWCASNIAPSGTKLSDSVCATSCYGNPLSWCGGNWKITIFQYSSSGETLTPSTTTTTTTTSTTSSAPRSTSATTTTTSTSNTTSTTTTAFVPAATTSGKAVYAHFMMGNTYSYTAATWLSEIKLASAGGVDGFALNLGTDSWQLNGLDMAYAAAASSGTGFKMFLSLDMTVFGCSSYGQADQLKSLVTRYAGHSSQAKYASKVLVGTFAGSDCTFGQGGGWSSAWTSVFKTPLQNAGIPIFFVPAVFVDTSTFGSASVMDGELNWNGGWPTGNNGIDFSRDNTYMSALGSRSQGYMAAVSPAFYTHYSPSTWNKNWLFKSDDWLFARRWQQLVENHYGESSYIGSILSDQPNSQNWVNGMDHLPLLEVNKYYATAFKTGQYPQISNDRIFLSSRPHSNTANAWGAGEFGRPTGMQNGDPNGYLWTTNDFFALVFAKAAGTVVLSSGSISKSFNVNAGVNFLSCGLSTGNGMRAVLSRSGSNVLNFQPSFTFTQDTQWFNWNYIYFASP